MVVMKEKVNEVELNGTSDLSASIDEAEGLLRRDPQESLRIATEFLDANTDLVLSLRARRVTSRAFLHMGMYAEGEGVAQESIKIAREAGERYEEAMAHNEVGVFRFVAQDYEGALGHYDAAEQLLRVVGAETDLSRIYLNIGNVYYRKNDVANSLRYYERTLSIAERVNDDTMLAKVLTNLTGLYAEFMQDEKTAIEYARRGVEIFERLNDKVGLAKAYMHLGIHAKTAGNYDEAIGYFAESIDLRANFSEPDELISTHCEIAECYRLVDQPERCEATLREVETLAAFKINTGMGRHYVNGGWANLYLQRKEYTAAIILMVEMLAYLRENGTTYLEAAIVHDLAKAYAAVGNYEEAVKHYDILLELSLIHI